MGADVASITSLVFHIMARYSGDGAFRRAREDIQNLNSRIDALNQRSTAAQQSLGGVASAAVAAAPAVLPLAAALSAVAGGLAAATVAAGASAGVFGFALKGAVDHVAKLKTGIGQLRDNLALQKTILSQMTEGTKHYGKQLDKVNEAQDRYNHAVKLMTGPQQQFIKAQDGMRDSYDRFIKSTEGSTLPIASAAMDGMARAFAKLEPLVRAVEPIASSLVKAFQSWVDTKLDGWIKFLIENGLPALNDFITIGKNLGSVLGQAFKDFMPLGLQVVRVLAIGSAKLKAWSEGGGFVRFLDYVSSMGPLILRFLQAFADLLGKTLQVMLILAPVVLTVATNLAELIAKIPTKYLVALVAAWFAVKAATLAYIVTLGIVRGLMYAVRIALLAYQAVALTCTLVTRGLSVAMMFLAANPIVLVIAAIVALVAAVVLIATKTTWFQTAWKYTWNAIKAAALAVWDFLRNYVFNPLVHFFTKIIPDAAGTVWRFIRDRWNDIRSGINAVWVFIRDKIFSPIGNFFTKTIPNWATSMKNGITRAFQLARDGIKTVWDSIVGIVKKPINFVIGFVNGGVIGPMNSVAKFVGLNLRIPEINKLARGGGVSGPGTGTSDSIPAMLSHGEHVWTAAEVQAAGGHRRVAQMRSNVLNGRRVRVFGTRGFAAGGTPDPRPLTPGDVGPGGISRLDPGSHQNEGGPFRIAGVDVGGLAGKLVRGAMSAVTGPVLDAAIKTIGSLIGSGSAFQDILKGAFTLPIRWLKDWIGKDDKANAVPVGGGGASSGAWASVVSSVLAELGESPANLPNVLRAIQKESGGNPNAINNWDSNAILGMPSKGLLQVIGPTFAAYAGKYAGAGVYDPHANIYAAINYARNRYGSGWSARMAAPGGYALGGAVMPFGSYDRGGYLPEGLSLAYNGTGKPEPVGHGLGGEPHFHFDGTFIGPDQRQFQDMLLAAWTELKRKNRV
ncbi:transglycosylase SLT domain-containing protein [Streptomyces sp. NPDC057686]|uniref:transglycosylase SLT domain-containing protein n=1 Tax=Streptomyces sp. NPDC057686 TaxID=3346212 RepID=UPI0036C07259